MLLIVGLDGATWDLLDPWIEQGRLPQLARMRRRGLSGPLESTIPPATLPSWSTFMTGVNPGKHGIFDFTRREFGTYNVRFVNATFRKTPTIWRRLSEAGRRVCVLGLPGTYPPERLNGCMVSGFDTPVTTRADASFVSPQEFAPLIMDLGGFPFADFQEFRVGRDWYRTALERLLRGIEIKTNLAEALLRRETWDCFLLLFGESDTVAHHFWKFHDSDSPRFDAEGAEEFGDGIRRVYEALDAAIGRLRDAVPEATLMAVSDHGFGGAGNKIVHLNKWLEQQGWQRARRSAARPGLATGLKRAALEGIPAKWQARAFRLGGGRWAARLESRSRFAGIEWEQTRVFSEELNYFPSIWLNLKGRDPKGTVSPEGYEGVRDDVCAALAELHDPEHGRPIVRRAWRREELYEGPWTIYAPDIVLELWLDAGYSYNCLPSATAPGGEAVRYLSAGAAAGGKLASMNGSHRAEGVFLIEGPVVSAPGGVARARIADMAATILAACEVPIPGGMDGAAIDLLRLESGGRAGTDLGGPVGERPYPDGEAGEIATRLRGLGYI